MTSKAGDHQEGAFEVILGRSQRCLEVPAGVSILDVLAFEGVVVPSVCLEGICGTCECVVLEGEVDHHCQVLTEAERAANNTMMICVSRAKGQRITLDL